MKTTHCHGPSVAAILGFAAMMAGAASPRAAAQEGRVDLLWDIIEVAAGTNTPVTAPNGAVEPGEWARFQLTVAFTPGVGSTITYVPPPPPGVGTVAGFSLYVMNLVMGSNGAGSWSMISQRPGWTIGPQGAPHQYGVDAFGFGQFVPFGEIANPANPINAIWQGVWAPESYTPRTVPFACWGSHAPSLLVQHGVGPGGVPLYIGTPVAGDDDFGQVHVVPAPGAGAGVILSAATFGSRRKRRTEPSKSN